MIEKKKVENSKDSKYEDGKIIEQSIKPGEKLSVGSAITLYIPDIISSYPDFTSGNYTISDIKDFADKYELELEIEYRQTSEYEPGTIIYQSRSKGSTIVAGQTLKVRIAETPDVDTDDELAEPDDCGGLC